MTPSSLELEEPAFGQLLVLPKPASIPPAFPSSSQHEVTLLLPKVGSTQRWESKL